MTIPYGHHRRPPHGNDDEPRGRPAGHDDRAQAQPRPTVRAAGLIFSDAGLLLVKQHRLEREYWLLPGGGVHFGESLSEALRRELREELRLEIDAGRPLALAEAISDDMAAYPKHVVHVILEASLVDARRARASAATSPFSKHDSLRGPSSRPDGDAADQAVSRELLRGSAAADALPRRRLVVEGTPASHPTRSIREYRPDESPQLTS